MASASRLTPQPRCPVICEDTETGAIMRCAKWAGHEPEDDHRSYQEVVERMCQYLAARIGIDTQDDLTVTQQVVIMKQARAWYESVVIP